MTTLNALKPNRGSIWVLLWLAAGLAYASDSPLTEFEWRQEVVGSVESGRLYRVKADTELFDGCRAFPFDVLVADRDGQALPFHISTPDVAAPATAIVPAQLLPPREIRVNSLERYLRQDARVSIDPATGRAGMHNQVVIRTPGRKFLRKVEVYGSEDEDSWKLLGRGYTVDHSLHAHAANYSIPYSATDAPCLQVRVFPCERNLSEPVLITSIFIVRTEPGNREWDDVPLRRIDRKKSERDECQVLVFDTGGRNRPIEQIRISAGDTEYARAIKVYGRNDDSHNWRWVGDGEIHRLGDRIQDVVALKGFVYRYIKTEIYHYDEPALRSLDVRAAAAPRHIVFEANDSETPTIFYGAADVAGRRDEMKTSRRSGQEEALPLLRLGRRKANRASAGSANALKAAAAMIVGAALAAGLFVLLEANRKRQL